jgi:serine/threonine-protein kinase
MAEVFLARDLKHRRWVALKLLRPDVALAVGSQRFLNEIEIAASLHHPHILPLYDSGDAGGLLYYVMPFVEGESLRDRLVRDGRLAWPDAVRLVTEIADGLHYAHGRGIVHRDIKPENVLLVSDHAVISDFGIARAVAAASVPEARITQTGMSLGTPAYMSPEQAFGEDEVDARSDVYSLACMAYEMLTGALPFRGPTLQAVLLQKSQERPALDPLPDGVPAGAEEVLRCGLSLDRSRRYPDAPALAQALAAAEEGRPSSVARSRAPTVAVLPFANLGGDPDAEFLSDGLSEELIHALTRLNDVRVVARTSAFAFKEKKEDVRVIGERLGADFVLSGSVRQAGSRLRVTAQLVKVEDGYQQWSERYDRAVGDVFVIQDEITREIVDRLAPALGGTVPGTGHRANPRAYELYLRGRHAWATRSDPGLRRSVTLFEQALAEDAGFDLARAAAAEALVTLGLYGEGAPHETFARADALAREVLARAPGMAEARVALACIEGVYHWRWESAAAAFREVVVASPGYPTAHHWYAINALAPRGRFPEARVALQQARFLDPLAPAIGLSAGLLAWFEGNAAAALEAFDEVLATTPRLPVAHYFAGLAMARAGRSAEAVERMRQAVELAPRNPEALGGLGYACAAAGRPEEARGMLDALARLRGERYVSPVLDAQVLVALGAAVVAVDRLQDAERLRAADLVWIGVRPTFHPLRGVAPYEALLTRIGLA